MQMSTDTNHELKFSWFSTGVNSFRKSADRGKSFVEIFRTAPNFGKSDGSLLNKQPPRL